MVLYLLYFFAKLIWTASRKPGADLEEANGAAPEARSSRVVVLGRGADGRVQERVLVVRDTGRAAGAAGQDETDWSGVDGKLTIVQWLVSGMILTLGIASAVLGLYAENYRSEVVFFIDGKCVYPSNVEGNYSAAAAAVLVAAQVIVNVLACWTLEDPRTGHQNFVFRVLFTSWITFFSAMYSFMIGDVLRQNPDAFSGGGNRACFVVNPLVYFRGSVFSIITMFCHLIVYQAVCANSNSSAAKAAYTRIQANNDPERAFLESSSAVPVMPLSATAMLQRREDVWTKLQVLKGKYLEDMKQLHGLLTHRIGMPITSAQRQMVQNYMNVFDRMISYLMVTKERLPRSFTQDTVESFEKQIVEIMETFQRRRQSPPQQPVLPPQQQLQPNPPQLLPQQLPSATVPTPTPTIPAIPPPPSNPAARQ